MLYDMTSLNMSIIIYAQQQNRAYADRLINESTQALTVNEAIQLQSQIDLDDARNTLQEAHDIREGTEDGSPLPIEEEVNFAGTEAFWTCVLHTP